MRVWLCVHMKAKYRSIWTGSDRIYIQMIVWKRIHTRNHPQTRSRDAKATAHLCGSLCIYCSLSFYACKQITELSSERNKHHWHCKKVGLLYNIWDMRSLALQHAWMLWIWIKMKEHSTATNVYVFCSSEARCSIFDQCMMSKRIYSEG